MENFIEIRMQIEFPSYPLIYMWIDVEYKKCKSIKDYISFVDMCFNESEISNNEVRSKAYYDTACVVYSKLLNTSWESLNNSLLEWQNKN